MGFEGGVFTTATLIKDGLLAIGDGYRAKNAELAVHGVPFARAANVNDGFHFADADCFPVANLDRVKEKVSRPGDVVFTSKGTVGRFAFVEDGTPRFVFSPQLCYWRSLNSEVIVPRFLYYWMHGEEFGGQSDGLKGQTDMADYVSLTDQRRMTITLPPSRTQQAIAELLGALDDKIACNRRTVHTLEQLGHALFRSWFIDFDPVESKAGGRSQPVCAETASLFPDAFENEDKGLRVPKGWHVLTFGDAGQWQSGGTPRKSTPEFWNGDIPWISARTIRSTCLFESDQTVTELGAQNGTRIVPAGSLLFVVRGMSLAQEFRFGICDRPVAFNQDLKAVVPREVPSSLLFFWLATQRQEILDLVDEASHGTRRIQTERLTELPIALPPPPMRGVFAAKFDPLLQSMFRCRLESRSLAALRDVLLPQLLAGQIVLERAERLVEDVA